MRIPWGWRGGGGGWPLHALRELAGCRAPNSGQRRAGRSAVASTGASRRSPCNAPRDFGDDLLTTATLARQQARRCGCNRLPFRGHRRPLRSRPRAVPARTRAASSVARQNRPQLRRRRVETCVRAQSVEHPPPPPPQLPRSGTYRARMSSPRPGRSSLVPGDGVGCRSSTGPALISPPRAARPVAASGVLYFRACRDTFRDRHVPPRDPPAAVACCGSVAITSTLVRSGLHGAARARARSVAAIGRHARPPAPRRPTRVSDDELHRGRAAPSRVVRTDSPPTGDAAAG
jgi:hypothetical protein